MPLAETVKLNAKRIFRSAGEDDDKVIDVQSGLLGLVRIDGTGRRQIIGLKLPGESIIPLEAFSYNVEALIPSEVSLTAYSLYSTHWVLEKVARDLRITQDWLVNLGMRTMPERIAYLLCDIATRGQFGTEAMPNLLTQQQIADITGQTSVNVNRVLAELERDGLIERKKPREITFKNWAELCRLGSFSTPSQ